MKTLANKIGSRMLITIALVIFTVLLLNMLIMLFAGCKKDKDDNTYMQIFLTDAPAPYTQVNVDLTTVEILYTNTAFGSSGWVTLATNAGVYNLLTLQNNMTTVLANPSQIPIGVITQVRLVLGTNNTVVVGGMTFPLMVANNYQTEVPFSLNTATTANDNINVTLDFNAAQSVILQDDGNYSLNPVITIQNITVY